MQAAHACLRLQTPNLSLSRFYIRSMREIAQRMCLRVDPEVKRTICRACQQLLVPGITSRVRLQGRREQHIVVTCLSCGRFRRFLCRPTLLATMLRTDPQPQQQQQPQLLPPLQQQPTNAAQSSTTEAPAPPTETAPAQTGSVAPFDLSRT
eukprot:m.772587 g.772587  ORF g.772587 m.772587 type:complete len:151 (+) comp59097_c0_seq17:200-652(+)